LKFSFVNEASGSAFAVFLVQAGSIASASCLLEQEDEGDAMPSEMLSSSF
jgi:hypothetical protein